MDGKAKVKKILSDGVSRLRLSFSVGGKGSCYVFFHQRGKIDGHDRLYL